MRMLDSFGASTVGMNSCSDFDVRILRDRLGVDSRVCLVLAERSSAGFLARADVPGEAGGATMGNDGVEVDTPRAQLLRLDPLGEAAGGGVEGQGGLGLCVRSVVNRADCRER